MKWQDELRPVLLPREDDSTKCGYVDVDVVAEAETLRLTLDALFRSQLFELKEKLGRHGRNCGKENS